MAVSSPFTALQAGALRMESRRRWRRDALAVGLALMAHAVVLWMFIGQATAPQTKAWTMEMSLVEPSDASAAAARAVAGGEAAGGRPVGGDRPTDLAEPPTSGDGTDDQAGQASLKARMTAAMDPVAASGEVVDAGHGDGELSAGGSLGAADNAYQRLLQKHIRPFRLYPSEAAARRAEGVVVVRFRVGRGGDVEEAWVVRRSRDAALDRAALETLWRAEPMPGVPGDLPAPVEVELAMPFRLPGR